jgi:hypothetical protein
MDPTQKLLSDLCLAPLKTPGYKFLLSYTNFVTNAAMLPTLCLWPIIDKIHGQIQIHHPLEPLCI